VEILSYNAGKNKHLGGTFNMEDFKAFIKDNLIVDSQADDDGVIIHINTKGGEAKILIDIYLPDAGMSLTEPLREVVHEDLMELIEAIC